MEMYYLFDIATTSTSVQNQIKKEFNALLYIVIILYIYIGKKLMYFKYFMI